MIYFGIYTKHQANGCHEHNRKTKDPKTIARITREILKVLLQEAHYFRKGVVTIDGFDQGSLLYPEEALRKAEYRLDDLTIGVT